MAATVRRTSGRALLAAAGLLAVGFLFVMVISGRTRPTPNLVKFEAARLMREMPDHIDQVELTGDGRRWVFSRRERGRWTVAPGADELTAVTVSRLEMSLRFMHVTAPVRVMSPDEYQGEALGEYELDPPRYTVSLHRGGRPVLATSFGGKNPQGVFQYVRVEGRNDLYLPPIFVGREWELVVDGVMGP